MTFSVQVIVYVRLASAPRSQGMQGNYSLWMGNRAPNSVSLYLSHRRRSSDHMVKAFSRPVVNFIDTATLDISLSGQMWIQLTHSAHSFPQLRIK